MISAKYDFTIEQGTDIEVPFLLTDESGTVIDLSGYTARMQIRSFMSSVDAVDTLNTENGRIELRPTEGKLICKFSNQVTEKYPAKNLVYDIELVSGDLLVTRLVQGTITVSREVTRV